MFIVWGQKIIRTRAGRAATFCPICRGLRCMRVFRVRRVGHVYYIPLGLGEVVAHEARCEDCGTICGTRGLPFARLSKSKTRNAAELAAETTPDLLERYGARVALEERLTTGEITDAERRAMILEPFLCMEYTASLKGRGIADWKVALALLWFIALVVALVYWGDFRSTTSEKTISAAVAAGATLFTAIVLWRKRGGWMRERAEPLLARSLRVLEPSQQEIEESLGSLRAQGSMVGRGVKARRLILRLNAQQLEHQPGSRRLAA